MILSKQKTALFFRLSLSLTVFGALFTSMSWLLILIGALGMVIFHSNMFFAKEVKTALDYARHVLILSFSTSYVFSILSLPYSAATLLLTKVALVIFLLLFCVETLRIIQKNDENNMLLLQIGIKNLTKLLADLAIVYIVVASLFKILHWQLGPLNANLLLSIGLFTAVISALASFFQKEGQF